MPNILPLETCTCYVGHIKCTCKHEIGVFSGLKNQIEGEITFRVDLQVMRAVLSNGAPYHFSELSPTPTIMRVSPGVEQDRWSAHAQTGLNWDLNTHSVQQLRCFLVINSTAKTNKTHTSCNKLNTQTNNEKNYFL